MTEAKFTQLVKTLEAIARKNPQAYKNQVWQMAILGYVYVFGMMFFLIGSAIGIVWLEKKYPLSTMDLWNRANWIMDLEGEEAAFPALEALLKKEPDHAIANFIVGKILISQKDERGITHVKLAMDRDQELIPAGTEILSSLLKPEAIKYT